jgi:HlyD family secretion protein
MLGPLFAALIITTLLIYAFRPVPVAVDVAIVERGSLTVTVDREGKTRVRERYIVSAPLDGRVQRILLHPGDRVEQNQTFLAVIEPGDPSLLDPRARAEAESRVRAMEEARNLAKTNLVQAQNDAIRARRLITLKAISQNEFEHEELRERAATFALRIAEYELDLARAALLRAQQSSAAEHSSSGLELRSPISGTVLNVPAESSRMVKVGEPLIEIGDTAELEAVIDVLSSDAVKIQPGALVYLERWGGDRPLNGRVRLIEPEAFLKISALGVEEQRVNILVDFTDPLTQRQSLGDGYRVEARIVVWANDDVMKAPAGAFFRKGDQWFTFRLVNGRAVKTDVRLGRSNGLETEVLEGLAVADQVILHPSDRIEQGTPVVAR